MRGTIVMLHCMWGGAWIWDRYAPFLEQRGWRCLRPVLRHHDVDPAAPPDPRLGSVSLLDYAADMESSVRGLGEPPVLLGHSMGGLLAIVLAARFPVGRLCLVAPGVKVNNPLLPLAPVLALVARRMRWPDAVPRGAVDPQDEEVLAREYWSWRFGSQSASFLRLQRMANRLLCRVTVDTLVVLGGKDPTVPSSAWDFIRARIGSRVLERVVFPESVHQIPSGIDRGPVADAICGWLSA